MFGQRIPRAIERAYAALQGSRLAEATREWDKILLEIGVKSADIAKKQRDETLKIAGQSGAELASALQVRRQYEEKTLDLTRTAAEQRLAALERERVEALDKLGRPPLGMETQWRESTEAVNAYYDRMARNLEDRSAVVVGQFRGVASTLAGVFEGVFGNLLASAVSALDQIVALSTDKFSGLAGALNSRAGRAVGIGADAFGVGFGAGSNLGRGKGAAAGAASGFVSGAVAGSVVPGIGTVVGGVIGAAGGFLGGLFGGGKKAKEERAELEALRADLLDTYGSLDNLRKVASSVGVNIDRAFSTKKPAEARKAVEELNRELGEQERRLAGIDAAIGATNARAEAWQARIESGVGLSAGEFERVGQYAAAAFAGLVKETGDALGALRALEPTFSAIESAQRSTGLEASATVAELLRVREVVGANQDVADSLSSLNGIMRGLGEAGITNRTLFQTFGADAGAQIRLLTERNVDLNQQMLMMQPTLQALWEGQQKYGAVTDEATAALLRQAEEQGIVGANMRDVNEQILDVLLAIADAFGAKLPAGLAASRDAAAASLGTMQRDLTAVERAAADAAASIEGQFSRINVPTIEVPYAYRAVNELPEGGGFEAPEPAWGFSVGGSVPFTPGGRLVRVAERETERIVSDSQLEAILSRALASAGGSTRAAAVPGVVVKIGERELRPLVVQYAREALANGEISVPRRNLSERGI